MITGSALHTETETQIPSPLSGGGFFNIGTWTIPSNTLTMASVAVFIFTCVFLLHDPSKREFFILPFSEKLFAFAIAGASWEITRRCGNRPGLHWSRYWLLLLSLMTSVAVIISLLGITPFDKVPLFHIFLVASFGSVLALLPRLFTLHPDSKMVQRVTPITLFLVLLVIFPSISITGNLILNQHSQRIDALILKMKVKSGQLTSLMDYDWSTLGRGDLQEAQRQISALRKFSFKEYIGDPNVWHVAKVVGRDDDLLEFPKKIMDDLLFCFTSGNAPRIADFSDHPYHQNQKTKEWIRNDDFVSLSQIIGAYYQQIARLFDELNLDQDRNHNETLQRLDVVYQQRRVQFKKHMEKMMLGLSDHWVGYYTPDTLRPIKARSLEMIEVLQLPVVVQEENAGTPIELADLAELISISLKQAKETITFVPGCSRRDNSTFNRSKIFRIDCYSYAPDQDKPGTVLAAEMRLVYDLKKNRSASNNYPIEIYYQFPVPKGRTGEEYGIEIIQDFASAVEVLAAGNLKKINGSVKKGFRWIDGSINVRVYSPTVEPFYESGERVVLRAVQTGGSS